MAAPARRRSFVVSAILTAIASRAAAQSAGANDPMSFSSAMTVCFFVAILAFPILAVLLAFACLRSFRPPDGDPTASRGPKDKEGLDASEIAALPLVSYRDVKRHRISDGPTADPLECAVCLVEFEDDDSLRLLPTCPHAFHPECVGFWLQRHVTCPLCRASVVLDAPKAPLPPQETAASSSPPDAPPVDGDAGRGEEGQDAARRRQAALQLPRSNSTGHERGGAGTEERFALRLPEHVRVEILMSHRLRHVTSAVASVRVRELGSTQHDPGVDSVGGKPGRSAVARLLSLFAPGAGWKGDGEDRSGASGSSSRRWWRREQEKRREAIKKTEP